MTLDALKSEINKLSPSEQADLASWLEAQEEGSWDKQIREDHQGGKLDDFIERAKREFDSGTIRELP